MAATGAARRRLRENALFDGELQIAKFFAAQATAPDIAAAVAAVSLNKADAVFAPESQGKGLKKVFDAARPRAQRRLLRGGRRRSRPISSARSRRRCSATARPARGSTAGRRGSAEPYSALAARMARARAGR